MQEKKKPLYKQLVEDLIRKIKAGEFKLGEPFPTQIELAKLYGTSEITSRRALLELVNEGYIYRTRGKGTFLRESGAETVKKISEQIKMKKIYFVHHASNNLYIFNHRFYRDLLTGLNEVCEENGVDLCLWDMGNDYLLPDDPDCGLVLLPGEVPVEQLRQWSEDGRRLVTVHFYYPHLQIPYVIVDNLTGGYLATEHLLSLGHNRIGIILTGNSPIEMNQEFSLRLQGYKLALAQHNLEFDPDLVCVVNSKMETEESGYNGFNVLMDLPNSPTAIFAASDYKAIGAIKAAKKRGMRVPQDISIVGYDDLFIGQFIIPNLTTINQNSDLLGKRAAELLLFNTNSVNMRDEIVPKLVVRDSTKERDA